MLSSPKFTYPAWAFLLNSRLTYLPSSYFHVLIGLSNLSSPKLNLFPFNLLLHLSHFTKWQLHSSNCLGQNLGVSLTFSHILYQLIHQILSVRHRHLAPPLLAFPPSHPPSSHLDCNSLLSHPPRFPTIYSQNRN